MANVRLSCSFAAAQRGKPTAFRCAFNPTTLCLSPRRSLTFMLRVPERQSLSAPCGGKAAHPRRKTYDADQRTCQMRFRISCAKHLLCVNMPTANLRNDAPN